MAGFPVPRARRVTTETVYRAPFTRWFMQHVREVQRSAAVGCRGDEVAALPREPRELDGLRVAAAGGATLSEILRRTHSDAFLVIHRGAIVDEQYFHGMSAETPHLWQSVSKSLVGCVAGNLVAKGVVDPAAAIVDYVPELAGSAYGDACVRHLLDMQVGIEYSEDYEDPDSDVNTLDRLYGVRPPLTADQPGSTYEFAAGTRKLGEHGRDFEYVSLNVNVLGWVMERATGTAVPELIRGEVWGKLGAEHEAYIGLDGAGSAQSEGGFCSSLRDLARFGLALCRDGAFNGNQVVPAAWVADVLGGGDREAFARSSVAGVLPGGSYRDCFWVAQTPGRTVFMGLGIYGQMLYVSPVDEVVVAKFSTQPVADDPGFFRLEYALCEALAALLGARAEQPDAQGRAPRPA
jgi:CubicO group peptidase (beta-lactamase class C family)